MKMKKLVTCACIATVGVAYLLAESRTKSNTTAPKANSQVAAASSAEKIAFVDSQRLSEGYYRVKELNDALTAQLNAVQQELKSMFAEYEKVAKEYQELSEKANNPALTEEGKQKAQALASNKLETLKQKESKIRAYREKAEEEIIRKREEGTAEVTSDMDKAIKEDALLNGYDVILRIEAASFIRAGLDRTDAVSKRLNTNQPKVAATGNASTATAKK